MILGVDIGSSATKAVLFDDDLRPVALSEGPNRGDSAGAFREVVTRILEGRAGLRLRIGITGAGRGIIQAPPEIFLSNEVVALALGAAHGFPEARSVIEIGAQTSRWVLLDKALGAPAEPGILDFALNDVCAAGSGAFLEQQAFRLKLTIEEFASLAATAKRGAMIAGRCSVFAKTDMIHLQQKGTPLEEIAYGLCQALARNFVATVLKGREALPPVLLAGGGARNGGLVHAFREVLALGGGDLRLPEPPHFLGALGAAVGAAGGAEELPVPDPGFLFQFLKPLRFHHRVRSLALGALEIRGAEEPSPEPDEFIWGFLGVDIGSVSTNLVLMDAESRVRAGIYLPTKGRPIEVLREGYVLLREKCPAGFELLGIGATGSGRHLAGTLLQADVVHNEITCQLRSAIQYFPCVDTVFEIGGQDSKFISARDGKILDFTMNKICAAGTGSFLEEQAEILGIRIEEEFSRLAASSLTPTDLGSRCTVFMESEISDSLGRGVPIEDISAGLAFSIARNYLEKVVAGRPVGKTVVFQGGVASNPSVVRAFALEIGREILVHPHNRISGAIGAAIMAKEKVGRTGKTSPDAAAIRRRLGQDYTVTSFTCSHCSNRCQVNRITFEDEVAFFGDTCERYTSKQGFRPAPGAAERAAFVPDLFKEREDILESFIHNPPNPGPRIGLPRASALCEFLPFWAAFFHRLGAEVLVSPASQPEILEMGLRKTPAETCLPIKVSFGHMEWFGDKPVDRVFFPSVIDLHRDPAESMSLCPYSENFPFMARAATRAEILAPSVCFNGNPEDFMKSVAEVREALGKSDADVRDAYEAASEALRDFQKALRRRGREVLDGLDGDGRSAWAVLGRPYTLHDPFLNLNLGRHLAKLGIVALPIDFLPLDGMGGVDWPGAPHWRYNQQVIQAALWATETRGIRPVVLTNFGCGLDAFAMRHVLRIFAGEPHLVLEFDEHRAEAGLITRLEAFQDEVRETTKDVRRPAPLRRPARAHPESHEENKGRKFFLPYFADHAFAFSGALRGVGIEAEVLPRPDAETVALGEQHSTGKECHAYSVIAGDFVKLARSKRRGDEVFFFPGSMYTCVLAQYDKALNYLAEDLGVEDFEAFAPTSDGLAQLLTMKGLIFLWQGLVAIDLLVRASCAIRPYEVRKGATDEAHLANLKDIEAGLAAGGIAPGLKRCAERLKSIRKRERPRPVVGIAGDIYTRINPVANHDLFLKLEELGCEVRPSSFFVDGVDFDLGRSLRQKLVGRKYGASSVMALLYLRKELEKLKVRKTLERAGPIGKDPTYSDIVKFSSRYVGPDNNEFLFLNIAKMVAFARQGVDGVINAICFNCMIGTVSAAIASKIRQDYGQIPIPTFTYTGSELAAERTKLEAFVYQVKQYAKRKKR
ncbi:MAG: acyl-CoA dehydratase activase [Candidatus Aminicenantales bacterium]|jgi:predicted CoA-substrate-specific enzyme activase